MGDHNVMPASPALNEQDPGLIDIFAVARTIWEARRWALAGALVGGGIGILNWVRTPQTFRMKIPVHLDVSNLPSISERPAIVAGLMGTLQTPEHAVALFTEIDRALASSSPLPKRVGLDVALLADAEVQRKAGRPDDRDSPPIEVTYNGEEAFGVVTRLPTSGFGDSQGQIIVEKINQVVSARNEQLIGESRRIYSDLYRTQLANFDLLQAERVAERLKYEKVIFGLRTRLSTIEYRLKKAAGSKEAAADFVIGANTPRAGLRRTDENSGSFIPSAPSVYDSLQYQIDGISRLASALAYEKRLPAQDFDALSTEVADINVQLKENKRLIGSIEEIGLDAAKRLREAKELFSLFQLRSASALPLLTRGGAGQESALFNRRGAMFVFLGFSVGALLGLSTSVIIDFIRRNHAVIHRIVS